jgi:hypothetical protein
MGDVEEELNLVNPQKCYQLLLSSHFEFLLQNVQCVLSIVVCVVIFLTLFFVNRILFSSL